MIVGFTADKRNQSFAKPFDEQQKGSVRGSRWKAKEHCFWPFLKNIFQKIRPLTQKSE